MSAFKPCANLSQRPSTMLATRGATTTVCLLEGEALGAAGTDCLAVSRIIEVVLVAGEGDAESEDKGEGADAGADALSVLLSLRNRNTDKKTMCVIVRRVSNSDLGLSK